MKNLSSGIQRHAIYVSEEYVASTFRVDKEAKQEVTVKQVTSRAT
jgi:hypothetical protein